MKGPFVPNRDNQTIALDTGSVASKRGGQPGVCTGCNEVHQLHPAGPSEELVCLPCAKKNPKALSAYAKRWMGL